MLLYKRKKSSTFLLVRVLPYWQSAQLTFNAPMINFHRPTVHDGFGGAPPKCLETAKHAAFALLYS